MPSLQQDRAFIESIASDATLFYEAHKISAAMNIAQGCLESFYGEDAPGNNLFGIKADPSWHGPIVHVPTMEFEHSRWVTIEADFRAYPTTGASLIDHGNFLLDNPRYANLVGMDYVKACNTVAAVDHYATDPNYGAKLLSIIKLFGLQKYDKLPATHWACTVGYFSTERQAMKASARLLTACNYRSIGIHSVKDKRGKTHWVVQVGFFDNQKQADEAVTIIKRKLKYNSISVETVA